MLGAMLVILAVVANFFIARYFQPPIHRVIAAKNEISAGEEIIPANLTVVSLTDVDPQELSRYILEDEASAFFGLRTRENIRAGNIILRESLALDLSSGSVALAKMLNNPENTFLILNSVRGQLPGFVSPGDYINIFMTYGSGFSGQTLLDTKPTPTPTPFSQLSIFLTPQPVITATAEPLPADLIPDDLLPDDEQTPAADIVSQEQITPTEAPPIQFPAVHPLLENIPVAHVARDSNGQLTAIGVIVPRNFQSLLIIGDRTNSLAFTLSGPTTRNLTGTVPLRPLSYNDIANIFRYQSEEATRRGEIITYTLFPAYINRYYPSIADSIRATQEAWIAREKNPGAEEMDEIIRGRP